jgi:hypothetical protein
MFGQAVNTGLAVLTTGLKERHAGFFLGLTFDPECGCDTFLPNVN